MKYFKKVNLFSLFLMLITIFSCNNTDSKEIDMTAPTISIRLVDAPGDFEAVNVEIVEVKIKMDDDSDSDNGWITLDTEGGIVNLLDFTGGISKVLVDRFPIPTGTLKQMRLVLGDGNTIVLNGETEEHPLKTPSGQQSGLKVKMNALIEEGFTYDFVLDFDVDKSIVFAGNSGNIILKPVLYASANINSGIIEGKVTPTNIPSIASVLVDDKGTPVLDDDFIISAYTDVTGAFALWGVPAGTYEIVVKPIDANSDYESGSAEGVIVTVGEITTIINPIELILKPGSIKGDITNDIVVKLTLKEKGTNNVVVTQDSNALGEFTLQNIKQGEYILTVSALSFASQNIEVIVKAGLETILNPITLVP